MAPGFGYNIHCLNLCMNKEKTRLDNRDDFMNDYTEMTAQRRHRRRVHAAQEPPGAEPEAEFETTETAEETPDLSGWEEAPARPQKAAPRSPYARPEAEPPAAAKKPELPGESLTTAQGADSRVPAEARRMAASPYGVAGRDAVRPGVRPVREREPAPESREQGQARKPARPQERPGERRAGASAGYGEAVRPARVRVGYAPGRMRQDATRQLPVQDPEAPSAYARDARAYLEKRSQPFKVREPQKAVQDKPVHRAVRRIAAVLLVLGFALAGFLYLRDRNGSREETGVVSFTPSGAEGQTAPAVVTFSVVTKKTVSGLRLTDSAGMDVPVQAETADNAAGKSWLITLISDTGYDDTVRLEVRQEGSDRWIRTGYGAKVLVANAEKTGGEATVTTPTPAPALDGEDAFAEGETAAPAPAEEQADVIPGAEEENLPGGEESAEEGTGGEDPVPEELPDGDEPPTAGGDMEGEGPEPLENPTAEENERELGELRTPLPTKTPEPEKEKPTATPPLTAEAVPESNPDKMIISTEIYLGTKNRKEKAYSRPAKEQIHMPAADEYTTKLLGVMTFRGDNFRRNASAGSLEAAPTGLSVKWEVEAGSLRGATQMYYGYGWPGQPAIARWSKQVRGFSNLYETKQSKEKLKEVIIAGQDGMIRFLDLDDGSLTRNSIKLGYPMRGTPSLHTRGAPFISVGQFARKLKNKTGRIGLRQYNLYNQKELKLIEGTDGKQHRPINDVGSFETSALVDRVSDTVITAGSNGALYLEFLDSTFDYNVGVLQVSPSVTMMVSKAKGQKNKALTAVESSLAAYDKYVFYADMGGVLRCIDTNTLTPVWAVATGDAVMAAVALDLEGSGLNLYTANMFTNRKKGNADIQIRRYDALTGKETWCTDIGVYKGKKDKDDVGAKASPVIGQHSLQDLVYFTVTGLSEDGRNKLGLRGEEPAALVALDKGTGRVVWALGLSSRSESSPVAVYDEAGTGWILQCEQNGTIRLADGLTGEEVASLKLEAEIKASPAVYNDIMVIGTTGKGTSFVYGIQIRTAKTADEPAAQTPEEETEPAEEPEGEAPEEMPEEEAEDAEAFEEEQEESGEE